MQLRNYIEKYNSLSSEDVFFHIPFRKEYVLSQIGSGKKVLDVGCLGGKFSQLIAAQNNDVWGIEVNPTAAAVAKKRGIRVELADVEDGLPFGDASFDVVYAGQLIECLYDTKAFFDESFRVLKRGGRLLLTTSNLNSFKNRLSVVTGGYLRTTGAYPEDHFGDCIRALNQSKLQELCWQSGFMIRHLTGTAMERKSGAAMAPYRLLARRLFRVFPSFSEVLMVVAQK